MNVNWTAEQLSFVRNVAEPWAQGRTQNEVATAVRMERGAMLYQLLKLGVKLGRGGRLVWTANGLPVDIEQLQLVFVS